MLSRRTTLRGVDLASAIDNAVGELEAMGITIPHVQKVMDYLRRHSDLLDIVLKGCRAARETFSTDTELSLEMYSDPDIEDAYPTLYIRQKHYDEQIFTSIENVNSTYESDLVGKAGWFLVTSDLRTPR
jgi:hypothetical protein